MRIYLLMLILATATIATAQEPAVRTNCGPEKVHFDVELDKTKHATLPIDPGKARVYFIQDLGTENPFGAGGAFITKIGIDGAWVGANKNNSWFSVSVEPGVHHLCANAQAHMFGHVVELAHFTAEAGQVYYFRIRNFMWQTRRLEFEPADSDQALYMISIYPLGISRSN